MNLDQQLKRLEDTRAEIVRFTTELDSKLMNNEIPGIEHKMLMHEKLCGSSKEEVLTYLDRQIAELKEKRDEELREQQKRGKIIKIGAVVAIITIIMILTLLMTNQDGLTGFAVMKPTEESHALNQQFTLPARIPLDLKNITALRVSGTIAGTGGRIMLEAEDGTTYLVAVLENAGAQRTLTTDKSTYAIGEWVQIVLAPDAENKSMYVNKGEQSQILDDAQFLATEEGEYQIVALIAESEDIIRLEANFTVLNSTNESNATSEIPAEARDTITFTDACVETCQLPVGYYAFLIVEPNEGATLTIDTLDTTKNMTNEAPLLAAAMPDITLLQGETTTLDMASYFTDPEDDELHYDISQAAGIETSAFGSIATIVATNAGIYTLNAYVTDAGSMVVGNEFRIIVLSDNASNTTNSTLEPGNVSITWENMTGNETAPPIYDTNETNETNETITNAATNATNQSNQTSQTDCSAQDPNARPLECLNGAEYFQDQTILITDIDRTPIARITPIGNLLIRGAVLETDTFIPNEKDYQIKYEDSLGNSRTSIWFSSATGNVHLTGQLYEENANIEPEAGSFVLRNKKGIVLAWANIITGDLHLRGNVIPYRPDIFK